MGLEVFVVLLSPSWPLKLSPQAHNGAAGGEAPPKIVLTKAKLKRA
jgi:hypothetical protein